MASPLSDFLRAQDWATLRRLNGWDLQPWNDEDDLLLFRLKARDGEEYRALIDCTGYPTDPPGVVFVNEAGASSDPCAWPYGDSDLDGIVKPPPNCFLCMPLTREGLRHHPEWIRNQEARPWDGTRTSLMDLLNFLHRLLHSSHYKRRRAS